MNHHTTHAPGLGDRAMPDLPAIDGGSFAISLDGLVNSRARVFVVDPTQAVDYFRSVEVAARMAADAAQAKLDADAMRGAA